MRLQVRMTENELKESRKVFNSLEKLHEEIASIVGKNNKKQFYDLTVLCRKIFVRGSETGFDLCAERLVNILCKMHDQE